MSEQEFKHRIEQNEFAEWARVFNHFYGTPKRFIDDIVAGGRHIIMDIDVQGKKKFDLVYPEAVGILLLPPSMEELGRRLRARGTDDEATIRLRLDTASREMAFARAEGKYEYTIINDDLEKAKQDLVLLVRSIIAA